MALDERRRQKKLQKKRAKHKKAVSAVRREGAIVNLMNDPTTMAIASRAALLHECLVPAELFETGMGPVLVSKVLPDGRIAVAVYLLDVYCLGVKDACAKAMSKQDYRQFVHVLATTGELEKVEAAYARKLVESCEAWASGLGLSPHADYRVAKQMFSDIIAENCSEEFSFGREGKPFYIQGPTDSPLRVRQVLETLRRTVGEGGFDTMLAAGVAAGDNF